MFAIREGKKGFRARAKDTMKGLTIDTQVGQDAYKANNQNITVRTRANSKPTLPNAYENKKDILIKLSPTDSPLNNKTPQSPFRTENASVVADGPSAWKGSNGDLPKLSEAMMNKNWRDHRRVAEEGSWESVEVVPWSAPPEQSKFPGELKAKPQRDEKKFVDYEHDLKRVAYRCMKPEEVKPELIPYTRAESVDPDLCLSAPATKTEFCDAETGTEERAAKYDPRVFQPAIKSLVRLDEMAPVKRADYDRILNWNEEHFKRNNRMSICDSSSITTVTLVDSPVSSGWETLEFPYAELRAVQGRKEFETGLSSVEETIRNQLSHLVEPQSACLPPEYLRKEYEKLREDRRRTIALANSRNNSQSRGGTGDSRKASPDKRGANDVQFNALLGKLNKLCAPRLRAFTLDDNHGVRSPGGTAKVEAIDKMEKVEHIEDIKNNKRQCSPSGDSGISGMSSAGARKRAWTLNPQASEFCFTPQKNQAPSSNGSGSQPVQMIPEETSKDTEPKDAVKLLETRVAQLEALLARQENKQVHFTPQGHDKGFQNIQAPYGLKGYRGAIPGSGLRFPAMNHSAQAPAQNTAGFHPAPKIPSFKPRAGLPMGIGGINPNPMPLNGLARWPQPQPRPTLPPNGANPAQGSLPFQGRALPFTPAPPATGTPLWVKSVFGPKPVSKPDRPFNPGDGIQAMRQQQYEEYLEHLRATDPNYAQSCRQRQARRADRQRPGTQAGLGHHNRQCSGPKLLC
ncbi:hypothetical protein F4808DRAFT_193902 [Astrocystis sublimbata]|nr:hypothetical protein F4808DRAFT_193902 [Astrocystis sublimbata]